MKIAIATIKGGLEDEVCPIFGRCAKFTIVDVDGRRIKNTVILDNPFFSASSGVGIKAAQFVVNQGVNVVVSGNFGPNAVAMLKQAGVKMIQFQGNIGEAVQKYLDGELKPREASTTQDHFGMGRGGFDRGRGGRTNVKRKRR